MNNKVTHAKRAACNESPGESTSLSGVATKLSLSASGLSSFNELRPSEGVDGQGAHSGTQAPPSEMLMRRVCFCCC